MSRRLAKTLVLHGDVPGALSACAEWWGVALSDAACKEAAEAFRNLWKRHGADHLRVLDLTRAARGHWSAGMMSREGFIEGRLFFLVQ